MIFAWLKKLFSRPELEARKSDKASGKKLYIGNLHYSASDEDLKNLFIQCGNVQSANVIKDKRSGKSRGYGFVEMSSVEEATRALKLNATEFMGRYLMVSEAKTGESRNFFARPGGRSRGPRRGHNGGNGYGGGTRRRSS
ncbi:MAG: RNA-binding protein [Candidatus Omnitrophica bacterium]|nr:RNA-binding protein [Candidatus Omnitrophota bacterium]